MCKKKITKTHLNNKISFIYFIHTLYENENEIVERKQKQKYIHTLKKQPTIYNVHAFKIK